jgi:hypothetical protein
MTESPCRLAGSRGGSWAAIIFHGGAKFIIPLLDVKVEKE